MTMTQIPTLSADPCARADALRAIRDNLISGSKAEEVDFMAGNGTRRRVRYGAADIARLEREIDLAQAACNGRPRRFVIGGRP